MRVIKKNSIKDLKHETIDPALGQRLRAARKSRGWTIKELSEILGISTTHLTRLELGQRRVDSMALLMTFAENLDLPLEELIALQGQDFHENPSYVKLAFPGVTNDDQIQAISQFATLISSSVLSAQEMDMLLMQATAMVRYWESQREEENDADDDEDITEDQQ